MKRQPVRIFLVAERDGWQARSVRIPLRAVCHLFDAFFMCEHCPECKLFPKKPADAKRLWKLHRELWFMDEIIHAIEVSGFKDGKIPLPAKEWLTRKPRWTRRGMP